MKGKKAVGVVLDAGAFIQLERRNAVMVHLARRFVNEKISLVTSAGVIAQVWRGGGGAQVPLVYLVRRTLVVDLTHSIAKMIGRVLATSRTADLVDAHVVWLARERGWPIVTSDPDDLSAIDSSLELEVV